MELSHHLRTKLNVLTRLFIEIIFLYGGNI
jgi:hypothetical protein